MTPSALDQHSPLWATALRRLLWASGASTVFVSIDQGKDDLLDPPASLGANPLLEGISIRPYSECELSFERGAASRVDGEPGVWVSFGLPRDMGDGRMLIRCRLYATYRLLFERTCVLEPAGAGAWRLADEQVAPAR